MFYKTKTDDVTHPQESFSGFSLDEAGNNSINSSIVVVGGGGNLLMINSNAVPRFVEAAPVTLACALAC